MMDSAMNTSQKSALPWQRSAFLNKNVDKILPLQFLFYSISNHTRFLMSG